MYIDLHVKYPLLLSDFNETSIFSTVFPKNIQISNFIKIRILGAEFHVDGQTWRSLVFALRSFANSPKKQLCDISCFCLRKLLKGKKTIRLCLCLRQLLKVERLPSSFVSLLTQWRNFSFTRSYTDYRAMTWYVSSSQNNVRLLRSLIVQCNTLHVQDWRGKSALPWDDVITS